MSSALRFAVSLVLVGVGLRLGAQETEKPGSSPEPTYLEHVPRVPGVSTLFDGFNAGFTFSGVHDSSIGWYNVATPAVSYTFSPHYSADASFSIYPYRLTANADPSPSSSRLVTDLGDLGDTLLGVHASFYPRALQNTTTASMTVPTGNRAAGLSTGRVTFDLSNHTERYFGRLGTVLDLGVGDSSGLFNRLVTQEYNSLGPIAHFQTGLVFWLPGRNYIESLVYEQLPIGDQKVYTTLMRPGSPPQTVVSGRNVSEDNGFTTSVGIPLTTHMTLTSYYNRSLRLHLDTASVGVTYVFRGTPRHRELSLIDRALLEAARANRTSTRP